MRVALACALFLGFLGLGCAGDDPKTGPPPLATSPVTPILDAGDAATSADAGPQSVTWSGSLASTEKAAFGGGPYCNYEVMLTNVKVDLTVSSDRTIATGAITWTVNENTVPPCAFAPQDPTQNSASPLMGKTAPLANGGFHVELAAATTNRPQTTLVVESNAGGEATAEWHRTDQPAPLDWRIRTTIPLLKK